MLEPILGYRLLRFFQSLAAAVFATYSMIYQIDKAGFRPIELVMMGTAMEAGGFLFEVPTGSVADAVSRKASILVGLFVVGLSYLLMGVTTEFWLFFSACLVWGIGETFISGAREAWAAEEIPFSAQPDLGASSLFLMGSRADFAGGLCGILVSAVLASLDLSLPIIASGACFVALAVLAVFFLPERGFTKAETENHSLIQVFINLKVGLGHVRSKAVLMAILVVTVFQGFSFEGFDRLWQKHLKESFSGMPSLGPLPEKTWWAILAATVLVLSWAATHWIQRKIDLKSEEQTVRVLTWITVLILAGLLVFAFAPSVWIALPAYLACRTLRKANSPLMTGWLNRHAPNDVRATVLSFEGQAHSFGEIIGGPAVGGVAEILRAIRWAMVASALLLLPAARTLMKRMKLARD